MHLPILGASANGKSSDLSLWSSEALSAPAIRSTSWVDISVIRNADDLLALSRSMMIAAGDLIRETDF